MKLLLVLALLAPKSSWGLYDFFFHNLPTKTQHGEVLFTFPGPGDWAAYLISPQYSNAGLALDSAPGSLQPGQTIIVTSQITTTGSPIFNYDTEPQNTCIFPAHARPFVAKRGWELRNVDTDRWWAATGIELAPGTSTITVIVDPTQWTDATGGRGDSSPAEFYAAFADPGMVGLSFGGGCFYGHGVYVTGGSAKFTLIQFAVN